MGGIGRLPYVAMVVGFHAGSANGGRRGRKVLGRRRKGSGWRRKERKRRALIGGARGAVSEGRKRADGSACRKRRAGRGTKLGRAVRCARKKEKGPRGSRPVQVGKEKGGRAQLRRQRASAGRGRKKRLGQNLGLGQNGRKVIFFKNKTFSKSIFSIFNSKPNSNKI